MKPRSRRWPALIAVAFIVAVAAPAGAAPSAAGATVQRSSGAAKKHNVPFQRAVTFGDWSRYAYFGDMKAALRKLKRRTRAKWVTLIAVWSQQDVTSTKIAPGAVTVEGKRLTRAIRIAHRLGLKVVLRPYVDRLDGGWRGVLNPTDVDQWFASYRRFIYRYMRVAQREDVEGFVVGSELSTMQVYGRQWRRIVRKVQRKYDGFVTYQANWNNYRIKWWGKLDAIDISAYFPLAKEPGYTVGDLVAAWHSFKGERRFDDIRALHRQLGLPVIFGEIGYRTIEGSAIQPWNTQVQAPFSTRAQKLAYKAALRVWYRVRWFKGAHWWFYPARFRGTDHSPAGPARKVLKRWYGRRR